MSAAKASALRRLLDAVPALLVTLVFAGLVTTVIALPPVAVGLSDQVNAELARTGIGNSVTATLLNFRGYDTLLEIAVLLLAVTAILSLRRGHLPRMRASDEIQAFLSRILFPVMILIAGYLLMGGLDGSGGAFQVGAILAAGGVLLVLTGRSVPPPEECLPVRIGLVIGLAAFVAAGIAGMLFADAFLGYPQRYSTDIVLFLEVGVSVSVAFALLEMFVSVLRGGDTGNTTRATKREER